MKLVSSAPKQAYTALAPRTYFVHIPKTAGVTLKAFLENNYAEGEALVIDEWKARDLPAEELRRYRLFSGHYSSEVLNALPERPDVTLVLVREPVSRFRSWMSHCRRLTGYKYNQMCEGRTDLEVLTGPDGHTCHQAHWLARAMRDGADCKRVPDTSELNELLEHVDLAGITDEIERFLQLLSFRMQWAPPALGWHINRRPESDESTHHAESLSDADVLAELAVDQALYDRATARFWGAYADMLTALRPDAEAFTPESARRVPVALAQDWLRHHFESSVAARLSAAPVTALDSGAQDPLLGEGWWWREVPFGVPYRWTGPDARATILGPCLQTGAEYNITIDAMGAADWRCWDSLSIAINGVPVAAVHERFSPVPDEGPAIRLTGRISAAAVEAQDTLTRITIHVPGTHQAFAHLFREESFNTLNRDTRAVGLAVHRVQIRKAATLRQPSLSLRPLTNTHRAA